MLYPLKFKPVLKDKIWGGNKLNKLFGKNDPTGKLGESWELSGYEGDESVVLNGFLKDNNLQELVEIYMGELVGEKIYEKYGLSFLLLFKLIDANDNLSIQVHPDDEVAGERHNSYGKTEMWYVVDAEPGAELIIGFAKEITKEEYIKAVDNGSIENLLQHVPVTKGDVFFIPAGLVHAIGKGVVVAEIQQSSDITYRIYDYKRTDEQGNERELHTDQAVDVISFSVSNEPKTKYDAQLNKVTPLVTTEFFTTNLIKFNEEIIRNYVSVDSFVAYMCTEGEFIIKTEGKPVTVKQGETILIPAVINEVTLIPQQTSSILEVYIS